jgi:hypothetical protein
MMGLSEISAKALHVGEKDHHLLPFSMFFTI